MKAAVLLLVLCTFPSSNALPRRSDHVFHKTERLHFCCFTERKKTLFSFSSIKNMCTVCFCFGRFGRSRSSSRGSWGGGGFYSIDFKVVMCTLYLHRLAGEEEVKRILLLGIEVQLFHISKTILFRLWLLVLRLEAEPRQQGR